VAALLNGQIQGTDATPKATYDLQNAGARMLFDIAQLNLQAATAGLVAQRSWVNGHKDLTQRYVDAIVEAIARERRDKEFEQGVMKKVFRIDDPKALDLAYDYYVLKAMAAVPTPRVEQFKATAEQAAKLNPKIKDVDPSKLIDASFVQSAVDRGLNK
jgi:ABC-type nitrate/sulfonate/bicarbonate transport system substrate-binding protein